MTYNLELTEDNFNSLLNWLSPDREEAGSEYEKIRNGLVKFFKSRGCDNPEILADDTITRVASKLNQYDLAKKPPKLAFFHGFARNVFLEYLYKLKQIEFNEQKSSLSLDDLRKNTTENLDFECLDKCLSKLKKADHDFIIGYYTDEKIEKIENRKKIAKNCKLSLRGAHVKAFRIRNLLKECILSCFERKNVK